MNLGMTQERFKKLNKGGDMNALCSEIAKESGLEYSIVVKKFPSILRLLTPKQSYIMRMHYLCNDSIIKIKADIGANSYNDIERVLLSSKKKMIKLCKLIVEVNNEKERGVKND